MWYNMTSKVGYKILYVLLYLIFGAFFLLILKQIFNIIDVYFNFVYYLIVLLYILLGFFLYNKNYKLSIIIYYIFLFIFLFMRESQSGINLKFYLFDWLSNITNNKIILINILGNILLFIPLGIMNKTIIKSVLIIILIEILQLLLKKGIFDVVDIVLNTFGVILGFLGVKLWMIIKKKKMKKR